MLKNIVNPVENVNYNNSYSKHNVNVHKSIFFPVTDYFYEKLTKYRITWIAELMRYAKIKKYSKGSYPQHWP